MEYRLLSKEKIQEMLDNHMKWLLHEPDGEQADFSNADLVAYDFRDKNLMKVIFNNARLCGADFSRSNLTKAEFSNSDLFATNFTEANLTEAKLNNSTILLTNFSFSNLTKTDMSYVVDGDTGIFNNAIITDVIGIDLSIFVKNSKKNNKK